MSMYIALVAIIILAITLIVQTISLRRQSLCGWLETYLLLYSPVTAEQVEEFKLYPRIWMDSETYKRYKSDDQAIRKYIYMSIRYEYLAFTYALGLRCPFGPNQWVEVWTRELYEEKEFIDVHENYRYCYSNYGNFVQKLLAHK